jgi:hypothetical protein
MIKNPKRIHLLLRPRAGQYEMQGSQLAPMKT